MLLPPSSDGSKELKILVYFLFMLITAKKTWYKVKCAPECIYEDLGNIYNTLTWSEEFKVPNEIVPDWYYFTVRL